jgi:hypothetical protein
MSPEKVNRMKSNVLRLMAVNEILQTELENIANAKPSEWGDQKDQFRPWAQNRARHALNKAKL